MESSTVHAAKITDHQVYVWRRDPNDRFVKWTQKTYLAGGRQAELLPLLERCTRELRQMPGYDDDIRYLRLWLQYVGPLPLPLLLHLRFLLIDKSVPIITDMPDPLEIMLHMSHLRCARSNFSHWIERLPEQLSPWRDLALDGNKICSISLCWFLL